MTERILLVLQYLWEESSESNYVTGADIMRFLDSKGLKTPSRNTIYKDIKQLQALGIQIEIYKGRSNHYWISQRVFSDAELQLLTDAVQAAQFITKKRSTEIIDKLSTFTSKDTEVLNRKLLVGARPKSTNESILFSVNELQYAINHKKKVTFKYVDYAPNKKKVFRHNGQVYSVSPFSILWNGDNYYMIGWSDSHGKVACFRVNRMAQTTATDIKAVAKPKNYREEDYYDQIFSMFDGPECEIVLLCDNDMMNIIIDRFGAGVDTSIVDEGHFKVTTVVHLSNTFYGWLCTLAGKIKLMSPEEAVKGLHDLIEKI